MRLTRDTERGLRRTDVHTYTHIFLLETAARGKRSPCQTGKAWPKPAKHPPAKLGANTQALSCRFWMPYSQCAEGAALPDGSGQTIQPREAGLGNTNGSFRLREEHQAHRRVLQCTRAKFSWKWQPINYFFFFLDLT